MDRTRAQGATTSSGGPHGRRRNAAITFEARANESARVGDGPPDADPLIVLDGVIQPRDLDLSSIDQDNIDRVEVMKGEAAIERYGERAADGVVIITTKKER